MAAVGTEDELKTIPWFHTIDLGDGRITPGLDQTPIKLKRIHIPEDLTGWSVLDVGAWDGFFSFEAERRGASRVVAVDSGVWNVPHIGQRGFRYAHNALGSKVEDCRVEVLDLSPETVGVFDLVMFLGVLYHLPHPLLALQRIASVTGRMMILETHVDLLHISRPAVAYYPGDECAGDPSNWCGPNPPALEAMLKTAGFREVKLFPVRRVDYKVRGSSRRRYGRIVAHAWT